MMMIILDFLSRKPIMGVISSLSASLIANMDDIIPWCQLIGIILGVAVGVLTIIAKLLEIKKLRKQNNKTESK